MDDLIRRSDVLSTLKKVFGEYGVSFGNGAGGFGEALPEAVKSIPAAHDVDIVRKGGTLNAKTGTGTNTAITYLYRDASNYKVWNAGVVRGTLTEEQKREIYGCCDSEVFFIPGQVGLPETRFGDLNGDDHCWFELQDIGETNAEPTVRMTASGLFHKFRAAKGNWDETVWKKERLKTEGLFR